MTSPSHRTMLKTTEGKMENDEMKNKPLLIGFVLVAASLLLVLPVAAQDDELGVIPVSGTYNYMPEVPDQGFAAGHMYMTVTTLDEWLGDFEGPATSVCRVIATPAGNSPGPCIVEFDGTVLADKQGTFVMVIVYGRMSADAEWFGDWWIISGTGDLANMHGKGVVWGPGFNPEDTEGEPDIYYRGDLVFVEPMSDQ